MKRITWALITLLLFSQIAYAQVLGGRSPKVFVYEDGKDVFVPTGWMGDTSAIKISSNCAVNPKRGKFCVKWVYDASKSTRDGWAGVYWQYPSNNWGNLKGKDLTGHKELTFWARGERGGEIINVKVGGIFGKFSDTVSKELRELKLSSRWTKYMINLAGTDLSNVAGGFCWTADNKLNPRGCTFYFDDIVYE